MYMHVCMFDYHIAVAIKLLAPFDTCVCGDARRITSQLRTITTDGNNSGVALLLIEKDMPGVIVRYEYSSSCCPNINAFICISEVA